MDSCCSPSVTNFASRLISFAVLSCGAALAKIANVPSEAAPFRTLLGHMNEKGT